MIEPFAVIGWLGAALFISAYFLLSTGYLQAERIPYQLMNVLGAICLVINSWFLSDHPNLVTNGVWMGIGVFAIINIMRKREKFSG